MGLRELFSRKGSAPAGAKFLIAGLGNVGKEYANTRHHVGFMVLDAWAQASDIVFTAKRYGAVAQTSFKGRTLIFLKPSTYMNLSGGAIRYWLEKEKIPIENLIVICDDLNLPVGSVRMRKKGSDGGHNGLKNIQEILGTQEYARIRIGIGNEFKQGGQVDFVLGEIPEGEMDTLKEVFDKVIQGVKTFATAGAEIAVNSVNSKTEKH